MDSWWSSLFFSPPTAESYGVSAQMGPGVVWGSFPRGFQRVPEVFRRFGAVGDTTWAYFSTSQFWGCSIFLTHTHFWTQFSWPRGKDHSQLRAAGGVPNPPHDARAPGGMIFGHRPKKRSKFGVVFRVGPKVFFLFFFCGGKRAETNTGDRRLNEFCFRAKHNKFNSRVVF